MVPALLAEADELTDTFNRICKAVRKEPFDEIIYGAGYLRLTAHVSTILAPQAFFFTADDESTDLAVLSSEGRLARFRVRFGVWAIAFQDARFVVTPRLNSEDEEIRFSESVAREISQIANVSVAVGERLVRSGTANPLATATVTHTGGLRRRAHRIALFGDSFEQ